MPIDHVLQCHIHTFLGTHLVTVISSLSLGSLSLAWYLTSLNSGLFLSSSPDAADRNSVLRTAIFLSLYYGQIHSPAWTVDWLHFHVLSMDPSLSALWVHRVLWVLLPTLCLVILCERAAGQECQRYEKWGNFLQNERS